MSQSLDRFLHGCPINFARVAESILEVFYRREVVLEEVLYWNTLWKSTAVQYTLTHYLPPFEFFFIQIIHF